jgi:chemotaxis protein histidine kinase CheA
MENIFYDEVLNKLNQMENSLIDAHETTLDNSEKINEIFRAVHTVKGVCDLLGFSEIVKIIHKSEDVLDEIRKGNLEFTSDIFFLFIEFKKFIEIAVTEILKSFDMSIDTRNLLKTFEQEFSAFLPKTVLFVDNGDFNSFAFFIEDNTRFRVSVRKDDKEAFKFIKENNVVLVFCDIDEPDVFGEELLNSLKTHTKLIPIVLLTATPNNHLKEVAKEVGAKAWIKKPMDQDQVIMIIDKILGK